MSKKWLVPCNVKQATGIQWWEVVADTAAMALSKLKQGEGTCTNEEIEVVDLGYPRVDEVTQVEE
jgi:hypothetical protein